MRIAGQKRKVTVTARVRFVVEVKNSGGDWGPGCTVDQVYEQSIDNARETLRNLLLGNSDQQASCAKLITQGDLLSVQILPRGVVDE